MERASRKTYTAMNLITGENYTGSAQELAKALKVSIDRIYYASSCATVIADMWEVEVVYKEQNKSAKNKYNFSPDLLQEWDQVTKPFKELRKKEN